jgi:hypothetical protein
LVYKQKGTPFVFTKSSMSDGKHEKNDVELTTAAQDKDSAHSHKKSQYAIGNIFPSATKYSYFIEIDDDFIII